MISSATAAQLQQIHAQLNATVDPLDEQTYRGYFHPDLSPLGWHYGHCAYVERYWLREVVLGYGHDTDMLQPLYDPRFTPKPERGPALPAPPFHRRWVTQTQVDSRALLTGAATPLPDHPLLRNDYLARFLIQHHAMHLETMAMVRVQGRLRGTDNEYLCASSLHAAKPAPEKAWLPAGSYHIGTDATDAFDNELLPRQIGLDGCELATLPVSNAEYLAFMSDGGYRQQAFWDEAGWAWLSASGAAAPDHWRQDSHQHWYGMTPDGPAPLGADTAVMGINHYEACAYVRWVRAAAPETCNDARLPHEYEWEAACAAGLLEHTGEAWEWCTNTFHPYPGFKAFPYAGYSVPWFDGEHYTLRGASVHTHPAVQRPSYRNFYNRDKRHIFAGLRLAFG